MTRFSVVRLFPVLVVGAIACWATSCGGTTLPTQLAGGSWDQPSRWQASQDGSSRVEVGESPGVAGTAVQATWTLAPAGGWIQLKTDATGLGAGDPIVLYLKAEGGGNLEFKLVDEDGSTFGRKVALEGQYAEWTPIVLSRGALEYWWGGDDMLGTVKEFHVAVSGKGAGTLLMDEIGIGRRDLASTFPAAGPQLDPDATLPGIGARQRRDTQLAPCDPAVLAWLEAVQDASPGKALVSSMEDNQGQTFNNALAAMAFLVEGERERAERILDFYARAMDRSSRDSRIQNFYVAGDPRGFFQHVDLSRPRDGSFAVGENVDRWMGDMAWLRIAVEHHARVTGTARYASLARALEALLLDFFKPSADGHGGYVQHGWRAGDARLHESGGHEEGNIDCYALFRLLGHERQADATRQWLDSRLKGRNLPLDLYTWRALAYGRDSAAVLDIPEFDLRFRKRVDFRGRAITGVFHGPDEKVANIWTDGTAHLAVAHLTVGDPLRGNFYANQLDLLLIERPLGGHATKGLPYATSGEGGYDWVRTDRGFASCAAWYIFAKHRFNPMTLEYAS